MIRPSGFSSTCVEQSRIGRKAHISSVSSISSSSSLAMSSYFSSLQPFVSQFQLLPTFHHIWLVDHLFQKFYLHFLLWCYIWLEFSFWLALLEFICGLFCQIYFWPFHHSGLARAVVACSAFHIFLHFLPCDDGVPVLCFPPLSSHGSLESLF